MVGLFHKNSNQIVLRCHLNKKTQNKARQASVGN